MDQSSAGCTSPPASPTLQNAGRCPDGSPAPAPPSTSPAVARMAHAVHLARCALTTRWAAPCVSQTIIVTTAGQRPGSEFLKPQQRAIMRTLMVFSMDLALTAPLEARMTDCSLRATSEWLL